MKTFEKYQITMTEPERGRVVLTLREKGAKKIARSFISATAALRLLDLIGWEAENGTKIFGEVI